TWQLTYDLVSVDPSSTVVFPPPGQPGLVLFLPGDLLLPGGQNAGDAISLGTGQLEGKTWAESLSFRDDSAAGPDGRRLYMRVGFLRPHNYFLLTPPGRRARLPIRVPPIHGQRMEMWSWVVIALRGALAAPRGQWAVLLDQAFADNRRNYVIVDRIFSQPIR
ncbi:MAG: hypothetical protein HY815_22680, partial [Candidatus Riflebacteria bacterium]|nr:hypothetical protein [Candidatus Riflebacteria bacterium]